MGQSKVVRGRTIKMASWVGWVVRSQLWLLQVWNRLSLEKLKNLNERIRLEEEVERIESQNECTQRKSKNWNRTQTTEASMCKRLAVTVWSSLRH